MKQSLHLTMNHGLSLTPQLRQAIRLLQLSSFDLQQEIQAQLDANPLLEALPAETSILAETKNPADTLTEMEWNDLYQKDSSSQTYNEDLYTHPENLYTTQLCLQDQLRWQLNLSPISAVDKAIGTVLIDAIDDNGYLLCTLGELQQSLNMPITEIEAVRHRIQQFEPIGCGVQGLAETLLIQLEALSTATPYLTLAKKIVREHLHLLGNHDHQQLMQLYQIDEITLAKTIKLIQCLHPHPGQTVDFDKQLEQRIPDLIAKKINTQWVVELNPQTLPKLHINTSYASLINQVKSEADHHFLKYSLHQARWFLKSIKNRHETLLKVAQYIVDYQQGCLDNGEIAMKPLTINDVATALHLHKSTISRVTTEKFISTPRGLLELKYFFSHAFINTKGGACSSQTVQALVKSCIAKENHQTPLSDQQIANFINRQGVKIARRTVTKYREGLGIAPSSARASMCFKSTGEHYGNQHHRSSTQSHPRFKNLHKREI